MDAKEIKAQLGENLGMMQGMVLAAGRENRSMTKEENARYLQLEQEVTDLRAKLEDGQVTPVYLPDFNSRKGAGQTAGGIGIRKAFEFERPTNTGAFRDIHDFVKSVALEPKSERSMSTWSGSDGGFGVPSFLMPQIWNLLAEKSFAMDLSWVYPLPDAQGNTVDIPLWNSFDKSTGKGSAAVKGTWYSEGDTASEQTPQMRETHIWVDKVGVWLSITRELLSDSILSSRRIAQVVTEAIAYSVDKACLRGAGMRPEPQGIMNSAGVIVVSRATAGTISYADCVNMMARIYPPNLGNTTWICSPSSLSKLMLMVDGGSHYIWTPNGLGIEGRPVTLLGRPVIVTSHASVAGTKGDLFLVDFSQYIIVTRGTLLFQASDAPYFSSDKIAMRGILRCGMHAIWSDAVLPENSGSTLGWAAILGG